MILLEIIMLSPETHLVKNHESQSRTIESQFKKTRSFKLKKLGSLCNQAANSLSQFSEIKTYSFYLKSKNEGTKIYMHR